MEAGLSNNTRFSFAGKYYVKPSRKNVMRETFTRLGPNIWNFVNNNRRDYA